jgi:hypothetical protein
MFLVYNGYKIQNFICDNEFSLNKDCFISFVIVVQKKLDQSLPLIVYSLKGACALKGCLPPACAGVTELSGLSSPRMRGTRILKLNKV